MGLRLGRGSALKTDELITAKIPWFAQSRYRNLYPSLFKRTELLADSHLRQWRSFWNDALGRCISAGDLFRVIGFIQGGSHHFGGLSYSPLIRPLASSTRNSPFSSRLGLLLVHSPRLFYSLVLRFSPIVGRVCSVETGAIVNHG